MSLSFSRRLLVSGDKFFRIIFSVSFSSFTFSNVAFEFSLNDSSRSGRSLATISDSRFYVRPSTVTKKLTMQTWLVMLQS